MKPLYDALAANYDKDPFNLFHLNHLLALEQIKSHVKKATHVTDLGIGTGLFAEKLYSLFPLFEQFYGIDLSDKMLEVAKTRLPFTWNPIAADAKEAEQHVPAASQDLILCHFLYDYVSPHILLPLAFRLLKEGGYLSILTSTKEQFDEAFYQKISGIKALPSYIKIREKIERSSIIASHQIHKQLATMSGFHVVADHASTHPIVLKKADELIHFTCESGWMASGLKEYSPLQMASIKGAVKLFQLPFFNIYPLKFAFRGSCLLLQKPIST
jgi:ubiquinone/menaquinone biosynthesis C-methylase UbiE